MKKFFLLILCLTVPAFADAPFWNRVVWETSDGVSLVGFYHAPASKSALTWVLLHGLGSDKEEWDGPARGLVAQGAGVLLYDARGHNESVHKKGNPDLSYKQFQTADEWDKMPDDLGSAVTMLEKRYNLAVGRISVGGASLGANVALAYAARHSDVRSLVLLSPGMRYASIDSENAFRAYGKRPVFIAASPDDSYAFNSVQHLASLRGDPACRVAVGDGAEHGVTMFKNPTFEKKLLEWMKTQ